MYEHLKLFATAPVRKQLSYTHLTMIIWLSA